MNELVARWLDEYARVGKKSVIFGHEQLEVLALLVQHLDYVLRERRVGAAAPHD